MPRTATADKPAAKKATKKASPKPARTEQAELSGDDWFAPVDDVLDYINVLYYGREGSAKTTNGAWLANAFPDLPKGKGRVLVINSEGGVKKRPLQNRGVDTSRVVLWPDPRKHERVTHASLDKIHRRVKADLEADPDSWIGVVFDSATEIHQAILDSVQQKRVHKIQQTGNDVDPDFVDIADYGTMSKLFRDILRKFRDLPCQFVITALERRDIDKDTGKPQYGPAVTPGLQSDILGYVDIVIMCKAADEDGPFRGLCNANSRYRAKDRLDVLPRVMVEPTMERIIKYVTGDLDRDTDPEQERLPARGEKAQDASDEEETEEETEDD